MAAKPIQIAVTMHKDYGEILFVLLDDGRIFYSLRRGVWYEEKNTPWDSPNENEKVK